MGLLRNLIYYSAVATRDLRIVAEYVDGDEEWPSIAVKCLHQIPPLHSRFSCTTDRRMLCCIIEKSFIFCTLSDQALGKARAFSFTEQVRDEFKAYLRIRGLTLDGSGMEAYSLNVEFGPIFQSLVAPFVGIPQIEKDRIEGLRAQQEVETAFQMSCPSPMASMNPDDEQPLNPEKGHGHFAPSSLFTGRSNSNKYKKKKASIHQNMDDGIMEDEIKLTDKLHKVEIMVDGINQSSTSAQMQRAASMRRRAQQMAGRMWWRNVKIVLILDAIVCAILFVIWLLICKGFSCIHKVSAS